MSRSKINHKKQNQVSPIQQELDRFENVARSLFDLLLRMNKDNAQKIETLLMDYQTLSTSIDRKMNALSHTQKKQLIEIREIITPEQRRELKQHLKRFKDQNLKEEARQKMQNVLRDESIEQARLKIAELMLEIEVLKNNFLKIDLNHSATIEHDLREYKQKRAEIAQEISKLDDAERVSRSEELRLISMEVNKHYEKIISQIESAKKAVRKVVGDASNRVNQMTLDKALTLAQDSREENGAHLEKSPQLSLFMSKQDIQEHSQVSLPLLSMSPLDFQTHLLSIINHELANSPSDKTVVAVAGLLQAILGNVSPLIEGHKTHFSVIYELNGVISSLHIGLAYLLNDPEAYITEITMAMLRQGVGEQHRVAMTLSSPQEMSALTHLDGQNAQKLVRGKSLQYLTNQVVQSAGNHLALTSVVGREVEGGELMRAAESVSQETPPVHFQMEQLVDLTKIALILIHTRQALIGRPMNQRDDEIELSPRHSLPIMTKRAKLPTVFEEEVVHPHQVVVLNQEIHSDTMRTRPQQAMVTPKQQLSTQKPKHELPLEVESSQIDEQERSRQRDNQRLALEAIGRKKRDLARKVTEYNQKILHITSALDDLDSLYYQNDAVILVRDEFKRDIIAALNAYRDRLSFIIQNNYEYDSIKIDNDINQAGDTFLMACSTACKTVADNNSFDYDVEFSEYFTDFMKLLANIVLWVGNSLPYRTNRNQFFDYANSKSAHAQFMSIQRSIDEIDVQHTPILAF
ncbi:hypothetical protein [Legionella waltersii]|uniref:Coiled-coil-containing protein n=1 Tax=Legionella waltersii TaxID=66969 RepID=A0A0W1A155_9GAMM|nr:hypothetical protein [Legionella waltersii]KTD75014.1 coiled-coil-containing protein [Legionella waltersii]SNV05549.1 coiled-coil-containing protein [Legionella waltersii]